MKTTVEPTISKSESDQQQRRTDDHLEVSTYAYPFGVPNSWRSALLNLCPSAAPIYELIADAVRMQAIDPRAFTAEQLNSFAQECGTWMRKRTFYAALAIIRDNMQLVHKCPTSSFSLKGEEIIVGQSCTNSKRGPKSAVYCLIPLSQQRDRLIEMTLSRLVISLYPAHHEVLEQNVPARMSRALLSRLPDVTEEHIQYWEKATARIRTHYQTKRSFASSQLVEKRNHLQCELDDPHSTLIDFGISLNNAHNFRLAYIRGLVLSGKNPRTYSGWKRVISVSVRRLRPLLRDAGFEINTDKINIDYKASRLIDDLPADLKRYRAHALSYSLDGKRYPYSYAEVIDLALRSPDVVVQVRCQPAHKLCDTGNPNPRRYHVQRARTGTPSMRKSVTADKAVLSCVMKQHEKSNIDAQREHMWLLSQLRLYLVLLGWKDRPNEGGVINPLTGEMIDRQDATAMLLATTPLFQPRSVLEEAIAELGGVLKAVAR